MKKIGVLVVTYNKSDLMARWIETFLSYFGQHPDIHLLVLDNKSEDGTYARLRRQFPEVDIRKLNGNYGCTTARNVGIVELDRLGCRYYCSCDDDVFIEDARFFEKLDEEMERNPEVDGVCPILRWGEDKSVQTLGSRKAWHGGLVVVREISDDHRVVYVPGGACFIRMSAFRRFGIYDNDIPPIGGQDYEWGVRATKRGARLEYCPDVEVFHYHNKDRVAPVWTRKWYVTGRMVFLRKHFTVPNVLREIRFAFFQVWRLGFRFMVAGYVEGMVKRLDPRSAEFEAFRDAGVERYYAEEYLACRGAGSK